MRHLDMVVCTDTAPAHLAGALGVPTRVLLGASADWRWGIGRAGTPLYPSVRLVRDGTRGDWAAAVDRVADELAAWGGPPPRGPGAA
jgi:ADP-heptose:LPS heptosyltransferase